MDSVIQLLTFIKEVFFKNTTFNFTSSEFNLYKVLFIALVLFSFLLNYVLFNRLLYVTKKAYAYEHTVSTNIQKGKK